jgi:tetratricopeptide (TPR) repeat protein
MEEQMKFIREDYVDARRRRNRGLAYMAAAAVLIIWLGFGVFKKNGDVGQTQTGAETPGVKAVDTTKPLATPANLPALVEKTGKSIALIQTFDSSDQPLGQGSGFFISAGGKLVSNRHVFRDAHRAEVQWGKAKYPITGVISENSRFDLAVLAVGTKRRPTIPLNINENLPKVGESVVVIGSPMGLEATVSTGIVSAVRHIENVGNIIQITCPISPGSSGSPVLNMDGEVIGVATFQFREGQNLNFAIPIARLKDLNPVEGNALTSIIYEDSDLLQAVDNPFDRGVILFNQQQYEGAISFFRKAVEEEPGNAEAFYYLGICYRETGAANAVQAFKSAIDLKPYYQEAYVELGITYIRLNIPSEAIKALKKALVYTPGDDKIQLNLGIAYTLNKQHKTAVKYLEKSLDIYPDALGYLYLGLNRAQLTQHDRAIYAFRQSLEIDPDNLETYLGLASSYAAVENWLKGIETLNKAVVLKPDSGEAHFLLGIIHLGNNDPGAARLEYEILVRIGAPAEYRTRLDNRITRYNAYHRRR